MKLLTLTVLGSTLLAWPCTAQLPDWTEVKTNAAPSARLDHGMVYDSNRKVCVLVGGNSNGGETWEYDGTNWKKMSPTTAITSRDLPSVAYDSTRKVVVVFGGVGGTFNTLRDHWEYDGTTWTKRPLSPAFKPSKRTRPAMVYDSARLRTIMFGGYDIVKGEVNDTWEFNGAIWVKIVTTSAPPGRQDHGMAYDSDRKVTVMFGGTKGGNLGDTWEYNGLTATWTQMNPANSPPAMHGVELAYDTKRKKTILFGGHGGAVYNTTYEWDGVNWVSIPTPSLPGSREEHAITHDSDRGKTIIFSGTSGSADTWEYSGGGCILTTDTPNISYTNGGIQTLSVEAPAHAGKNYWIFGSVTGTSPGIAILGVKIPLNPDLYTNFTIAQPNAAPFTTFRGPLNAKGQGTGQFTLPPGVLSAAFTVNHAFVVFDSAGLFHCASNAMPLNFIQ